MSRLNPLQRWSATAFLVAGAFLIAFAARNAIIAFGSGFSESTTAALYVAFVVPAELAAYVGLLGLHPRLANRGPRLAGAGAVFAGVAGVAMLGFGAIVGGTLLAGSTDPPAVGQLLWLVALVTTILAFLVFGAAGLRSRGFPRRVGLLLLVPPVTYVVMMAGAVAGYTPGWSTFALSALQAVAHLAVGLALRGAPAPSGRGEPAPDSTA